MHSAYTHVYFVIIIIPSMTIIDEFLDLKECLIDDWNIIYKKMIVLFV